MIPEERTEGRSEEESEGGRETGRDRGKEKRRLEGIKAALVSSHELLVVKNGLNKSRICSNSA